jgi:arylsulfatase A-like enzyme
MLPTLADVAGAPAPEGIDGLSLLPMLLGQPGRQRHHTSLYWEFHEQGGKQAVLMGRWKAVRLQVGENPEGPLELYDLEKDPQESRDIALLHPERARELAALMINSRTSSKAFNFRQGTFSGKRPADPEAQR